MRRRVRWGKMRAYITRESVCAADDLHAPRCKRFRLPKEWREWSWEQLIVRIWEKSDLPRNIQGGQATWALSSGIPLAVAAQQWSKPKFLRLSDIDRRGWT